MESYEDTFDSSEAAVSAGTVAATGAAVRVVAPSPTPTRTQRPSLTFPGLKGVELPFAATKPLVSNVDASGEARDRDTLIITRQHRGMVANTERNSAPTEAQMALRDFSAYHPQPVATWNKNYLNELAYAETRYVNCILFGGCQQRKSFTLTPLRAWRLPPPPPSLPPPVNVSMRSAARRISQS